MPILRTLIIAGRRLNTVTKNGIHIFKNMGKKVYFCDKKKSFVAKKKYFCGKKKFFMAKKSRKVYHSTRLGKLNLRYHFHIFIPILDDFLAKIIVAISQL